MFMRVAADSIHSDRNVRVNNHQCYDLRGYQRTSNWQGSTIKQGLTDGGVRHDDHHIGVAREVVDKSSKVGVSYFHALKGALRPAI